MLRDKVPYHELGELYLGLKEKAFHRLTIPQHTIKNYYALSDNIWKIHNMTGAG
jgi:hypothetical protein